MGKRNHAVERAVRYKRFLFNVSGDARIRAADRQMNMSEFNVSNTWSLTRGLIPMRDCSIVSFLGSYSLAMFLLMASPSQTHGQEPEGGNNARVTAERNFRLYCSSCHGEDGRGDGPKAFGLSRPPPDLTTLSARNGGLFPKERLHRIIDGREDIKVHGEREMPVWGQWFKMEAEEDLGGAEGDEGTVQRRIQSLIDFLATMQR